MRSTTIAVLEVDPTDAAAADMARPSSDSVAPAESDSITTLLGVRDAAALPVPTDSCS